MGRQRCHPFSQPLELEVRRKVVRKHTSGEYGAQGCWRPAEAPGGSIHCLVSMGQVRGREGKDGRAQSPLLYTPNKYLDIVHANAL